MGLKRSMSSGTDLVDLASVVAAMETANLVNIRVVMSVDRSGGFPKLLFIMSATDQAWEIGEAAPLASVRLRTGSHDLNSMEAAILQSLYKLDASLAEIEMAAAEAADRRTAGL